MISSETERKPGRGARGHEPRRVPLHRGERREEVEGEDEHDRRAREAARDARADREDAAGEGAEVVGVGEPVAACADRLLDRVTAHERVQPCDEVAVLDVLDDRVPVLDEDLRLLDDDRHDGGDQADESADHDDDDEQDRQPSGDVVLLQPAHDRVEAEREEESEHHVEDDRAQLPEDAAEQDREQHAQGADEADAERADLHLGAAEAALAGDLGGRRLVDHAWCPASPHGQ